MLAPGAAIANPVDCIASATPEQYRQALEIVFADDAIDAAIVIFAPPLVTKTDEVAEAVASVAARATEPILANFFAIPEALSALRASVGRVPWFAYPESAARGLAHVVPYASWCRQPDVAPPPYGDIDTAGGRAVVKDPLAASGDSWLDAAAARRLLSAYGIPHLRTIVATSSVAAVQAAAELGYPVAIKIDMQGRRSQDRRRRGPARPRQCRSSRCGD